MKNHNFVWKAWLVLSLLPTLLKAQEIPFNLDYGKIDKKALSMPDASASNPDAIAAFFMQQFETDAERVRATFVWIASNIRYDIGRLGKQEHYKKEKELVANVLRKRRGLCGEYAALFKAVATAMNIPSETIVGYTRTDGRLDTVPHAWNSVMLNGKWHLIDATWGAGHIKGSRFYPNLDNTWFLTDPEVMVRSHMPFEQMWQLLGQPLSYRDFAKGIHLVYKDGSFSFADSITAHLALDTRRRTQHSYQRLAPHAQENKHLRNYVRELESELAYYHNTGNQDLYNEAVDAFNAGIDTLNAFLIARNQSKVNGKNKDVHLVNLQKAENLLDEAIEKLEQMSDPDKLIKPMRDQTMKATKKALADITAQKKWLESLR